MNEQNDLSDFYEKFSKYNPRWIQTVEECAQYQGQPSFVKFIKINGEELAFLGNETSELLQEKTSGGIYTYKTCKIFIPKGTQVIDSQKLGALLQGERDHDGNDNDRGRRGHFDYKCIPEQDFFFADILSEDITLNVCTNIGLVPEEYKSFPDNFQLDLHLCDRFIDKSEFQAEAEKKYSQMAGICFENLKVISSWDGLRPQYQPVIFYIKSDVIKQNDSDESYSVEKKLFITWREQSEGYFLMPGMDANEGCSYICISNDNDYSYRYGKGVKSMLHNWIEKNRDGKAYVAVDDVLILAIDEWNSSLYRDVLLVRP